MFLDLEFPRSVSAGLVWGIGWEDDVVIEGGGGEVRGTPWSEPLRDCDAAKACETEQQKKDLIAFFRIAQGRRYSFKIRDWSDYVVDQSEGKVRALTATTFQLYKRHTLDSLTSDQDITLPETDDPDEAFVVYDTGGNPMTAGVSYTLDELTGILTTIGSPVVTPLTWKGPYFIRARFDTKRIALVAETLEFFRSQNIPIKEVRYEAEVA
jgi:uncharacterized protein (TIGR02217 family)